MEQPPANAISAPSKGKRCFWGLPVVILLLLLLLGSAAIPFQFESATIKYKFGFDKTLLRAGKILGLAAGVLMLVQMLIGARFKFLDRIFTLNKLYGIHRGNAVVIAFFALVHPLLIFAPEDVTTIPVSLEFLPEIAGFILLCLLWGIMGTGLWRRFLDLPFQNWRIAHRLASVAAGAALFIHVLYVSDTFESGIPFGAAIVAAIVYGLLLIRALIAPYMSKRNRFVTTEVSPAGRDSYNVVFKPESGLCFDYMPGQFAFIRLFSGGLPAEEHPFTISSTPTRPESIHFTIRCLGDWTSLIGRLQAGDEALIDGPYGLFTCLTAPPDKELILVAGGIGITPMLSMLRYMADVEDERQVLLLYSNQTGKDIIFPDEFAGFEKRLENFKLIHILSREPDYEGEKGRLDSARLKRLLADRSRGARVYVCGPPPMMKSVRRDLIQLGFPRSNIVLEEFNL